MASAQASAEECVEYILKIYDEPLEAFELKLGLTEEGRRIADAHEGEFTEDMIEWQVNPKNFGAIEVTAKPHIHPHVCELLRSRRLAHSIGKNNVISVTFP